MIHVVEASILLQLVAAILALRLIPLTRHRLAWGLWCAALILMAVRRGTSFLALSGSDFRGIESSAEWIALTISSLLVVSMYMLGPLFLAMRASQEALAEQLEERHRMARELHDTLGQSFAGVLMQLEAAEASVNDPERAEAHRQKARKMAQSGLHEARDGLLFLKQPNLAAGELTASLEKLAAQVRRDYDQRIEFHCDEPIPDLEPLIASECFRIVQEAIINAARHAGSGTIEVKIQSAGRKKNFTVRDQGQGLDSKDTNLAGFGLTSIHERAARIGAELTIDSKPGTGTSVQLTLRV